MNILITKFKLQHCGRNVIYIVLFLLVNKMYLLSIKKKNISSVFDCKRVELIHPQIALHDGTVTMFYAKQSIECSLTERNLRGIVLPKIHILSIIKLFFSSCQFRLHEHHMHLRKTNPYYRPLCNL